MELGLHGCIIWGNGTVPEGVQVFSVFPSHEVAECPLSSHNKMPEHLCVVSTEKPMRDLAGGLVVQAHPA